MWFVDTLPLRMQLQDVRSRFAGKKNINNDPNLRRHWRPSLNRYVHPPYNPMPLFMTLKSHLDFLRFGDTPTTVVGSPYLNLPLELRNAIDSFLTPADVAATQQCCRKPRFERDKHKRVQDLVPIQLYSFRRRLDRDSFPLLCKLETDERLPYNIAVCSACLTVHDRKFFRGDDVARFTSNPHSYGTNPDTKRCAASDEPMVVCYGYKASPSTLGDILEHIAAWPDGDDLGDGQWAECRTKDGAHIPLVWFDGWFLSNRGPCITNHVLTDERGLVVEQHNHVDSNSRGWSWLHDRQKQDLMSSAMCSHLHMRDAQFCHLVTRNDFPNGHGYVGKCGGAGCATKYGYFECEDEIEPDVKDICLRVQRCFGWLENLESEGYWRDLRWKYQHLPAKWTQQRTDDVWIADPPWMRK